MPALIALFKYHTIKWKLLSIVSCTVLPLSSKWNWRSVCMTPHYILQRKRRWKMKWDSGGTSSQNSAGSVSTALSQRTRQRDRARDGFPSVWHSAFPGYRLICAVVFLLKHQLGVTGTGELEFCLCPPHPPPFICSSFIWIHYPPAYFYSFSLLLVLSSLQFSGFSRLSSHLSIFPSLPSTLWFLSSPTPSFCLSIFVSPGLTVWKLDESDCMWQSGVWVNLMWLIWCLLTVRWKSFTVEEPWLHYAIFSAQLSSLTC